MLEELHFAGAASAGPNNPHVPSSLKEAFSGPDCEKWRAALDEEITSLQQNDVYEVVPIPSGVKPITSKPVMRIKFDRSGDIERYKLRIVARGFVQKEGVDYKEVFAPVANLESIRIILALAAKYNLELDQMDVATAYLNGELEEELYLLPPDGVQIPDGHCWRLKRSLYGLKQAGRTWNKTLDRSLTSLGFTPRSYERGRRDLSLPVRLKVGSSQLPVGYCVISWESYSPNAIVKFEDIRGTSVTVEGRWVNRDEKYSNNAVVYLENKYGSRTLLEIRFDRMGQALVFGRG